MEPVALAPGYIPLIQKPKCCAVACLQMILYRNGFGLRDQEDLAIEFGVKIGPDDQYAFREDMPVMTKFNFDEGISTLGSVDRINEFFARDGIALRAEAMQFSTISSLKDLIVENLAQNNDIWIEYHTKEIHSTDGQESKIHDAVVESFDAKSGTAVLIDPKPGRRQRVAVPLDMLERALSDAYGKELGLVIVRKV